MMLWFRIPVTETIKQWQPVIFQFGKCNSSCPCKGSHTLVWQGRPESCDSICKLLSAKQYFCLHQYFHSTSLRLSRKVYKRTGTKVSWYSVDDGSKLTYVASNLTTRQNQFFHLEFIRSRSYIVRTCDWTRSSYNWSSFKEMRKEMYMKLWE